MPGTVDPEESQALDKALGWAELSEADRIDPQRCRGSWAWQIRLARLAAALPPATLPPGLWERIEQGLAEAPAAGEGADQHPGPSG